MSNIIKLVPAINAWMSIFICGKIIEN